MIRLLWDFKSFSNFLL
uniref:Uncharacterized protein n=1 Tax=Lepeophtheirus salmonis TaxID=72036 RepID=A0A0K2UYZ9_LEPSM